jgi:hypothetical protein
MTDQLNPRESFAPEKDVKQGLYSNRVDTEGSITRKRLQETTPTLNHTEPASSAGCNEEVTEEFQQKKEIQGETAPNQTDHDRLNPPVNTPQPQMETLQSIHVVAPYYDVYPESDCIFTACLACVFGTILTPIFGLCFLTSYRDSFSMSGVLIGTAFPMYIYGIGKRSIIIVVMFVLGTYYLFNLIKVVIMALLSVMWQATI